MALTGLNYLMGIVDIWSSTSFSNTVAIGLSYDDDITTSILTSDKGFGQSVRCMKAD